MRGLSVVLRDGRARCALVWSVVSASSLVATAGWSQTLTWLGTLSGPFSLANGVSADGSVVVGLARNDSGLVRAFRWTASGGMQDLGTLGGNSDAAGVSADGSVMVGSAYNAAGQSRAFRWTLWGGMEDLNQTYASLLTNGSLLVSAFAISPDGRYIVGMGYNAAAGRYNEAFLLDTVPEPASLMALGAGLTGLIRLRRRKR